MRRSARTSTMHVYHICVRILLCFLILRYASSYYYICDYSICVRILLFVREFAYCYVSSYYYMCPQNTTTCVSSSYYTCVGIRLYMCYLYYVCVIILLYVCPHTTICTVYLSTYYSIFVRILLCVLIPHTYTEPPSAADNSRHTFVCSMRTHVVVLCMCPDTTICT
jgi:hypothetical protein